MVRRTFVFPEGEFNEDELDARAARHSGVRVGREIVEGRAGKENLVQLEYEFPTPFDADDFMPESPQ